MKIIIRQLVKFKGERFPIQVRKTFQSVVIPYVGISITDSMWKDPYDYKVVDVMIDYQDDCCYVDVEQYKGEISVDYKEDFAKIVKLHGWVFSWDEN